VTAHELTCKPARDCTDDDEPEKTHKTFFLVLLGCWVIGLSS